MRFFRDSAKEKMHGMIDIAIIMSAKEYVDDDNRYWEKVDEIRAFEDETETKLTEIYTKWYERYLSNV